MIMDLRLGMGVDLAKMNQQAQGSSKFCFVCFLINFRYLGENLDRESHKLREDGMFVKKLIW